MDDKELFTQVYLDFIEDRITLSQALDQLTGVIEPTWYSVMPHLHNKEVNINGVQQTAD